MQLTSLIKGTLVKRYKRFLADIKLENGEIVTAHCPNSGSMMGINVPNSTVFISKVDSPTAKLKYKWELSKIDNAFIGCNTHKANAIVDESLRKGKIPELKKYNQIQPEKVYKKGCRFDFFLSNDEEKAFLEVKSVTLSRTKSIAEFPDAETTRGLKHIKELIEATKNGFDSYLLFLIQRTDCNTFSIAKDIDSNYYEGIKEALNNNVNILCYDCDISPFEINIKQSIKFIL